MSGKAFGWAREQRCSGGIVAKAVLLLMADYADREHQAFPSVPTLAAELQAHERTIQRAIASLEADALIARELRATAAGKKTSSRYLLAVDADVAGRGDTRQSATCTGGAAPPSQVAERHHDPGAAPPSTTFEPLQVTEESADALSSARASFDAVELAWGAADPDRVAPPLDWKAWLKATQSVDPARLERAAMRYLAESADVKRGRCKALAVWLAEERWRAWLGDPAPEPSTPEKPPAPRWLGPPEIRAAAVGRWGEDFARSFIDPSGWDDEARTLLSPTATGMERLQRDLGGRLLELGVSVGLRRRVPA